jgi:hypothetical protein
MELRDSGTKRPANENTFNGIHSFPIDFRGRKRFGDPTESIPFYDRRTRIVSGSRDVT